MPGARFIYRAPARCIMLGMWNEPGHTIEETIDVGNREGIVCSRENGRLRCAVMKNFSATDPNSKGTFKRMIGTVNLVGADNHAGASVYPDGKIVIFSNNSGFTCDYGQYDDGVKYKGALLSCH